ncbi:MAG: C2H2-type zinc finger protein [Candidatus Nanohaloarchaeota archaeon QJJ-9]|nr:C2H2-type zinc finger protein [Candidatus Nanohaloarchaeota archaeon QJJ-9]
MFFDSLVILALADILLTAIIAFDAFKYRHWMDNKQKIVLLGLVVLFPVVGAVFYLLYVIFKEQELVECPECGKFVEHDKEVCPHCGYDSREKEEDRGEEAEVYRCDSCGEEFDTWRGLNVHKSKEHQSEETRAYECEECGDTFDTERGLNIHKSRKHG